MSVGGHAGGVDPRDHRHVASRYATGVAVVATVHQGIRYGMTINTFASVSLDPVLVLFCCERDASLHAPLLASGTWAVSVLTAAQQPAARWFATRGEGGVDQFDEWMCDPGPQTGAPVLCDVLAFFECRTWATYDGGDHTIVVGEVLGLSILNDDKPLLYFRSAYGTVAD